MPLWGKKKETVPDNCEKKCIYIEPEYKYKVLVSKKIKKGEYYITLNQIRKYETSGYKIQFQKLELVYYNGSLDIPYYDNKFQYKKKWYDNIVSLIDDVKINLDTSKTIFLKEVGNKKLPSNEELNKLHNLYNNIRTCSDEDCDESKLPIQFACKEHASKYLYVNNERKKEITDNLSNYKDGDFYLTVEYNKFYIYRLNKRQSTFTSELINFLDLIKTENDFKDKLKTVYGIELKNSIGNIKYSFEQAYEIYKKGVEIKGGSRKKKKSEKNKKKTRKTHKSKKKKIKKPISNKTKKNKRKKSKKKKEEKKKK